MPSDLCSSACLGLLLDLRLGLARLDISPLMRVALPLALWTVLTVPLTGGALGLQINLTLSYFLIFFVIAQGVQSFRALRVVALSILSISLFLGGIAIVQARSPFQCVLVVAGVPGDDVGRPDGRDCESAAECRVNMGPGEDYVCERPGPLNTTSVGHGRVRYRGILADPNELALALCMAIPLALIVSVRKRSLWRPLLFAATVAIVLPVTIWTASRTGQLVFVTVLAVYMLQRAGWKGLLAAAVLAGPVLLLGGRSAGEADESSLERLEAWSAGLHMFTSSPIWGIGKGQFTEHHILTAHNTFVLLLAELGLVGLALWIGMFYVAIQDRGTRGAPLPRPTGQRNGLRMGARAPFMSVRAGCGNELPFPRIPSRRLDNVGPTRRLLCGRQMARSGISSRLRSTRRPDCYGTDSLLCYGSDWLPDASRDLLKHLRSQFTDASPEAARPPAALWPTWWSGATVLTVNYIDSARCNCRSAHSGRPGRSHVSGIAGSGSPQSANVRTWICFRMSGFTLAFRRPGCPARGSASARSIVAALAANTRERTAWSR